MANPYTDVRAITARLGQVQPRGATPVGGLNPASPTKSKEAIQLGRAANKYSIQNPELRAQIEAIANGSRGTQPEGVWGAVLGNPVTKVALKGLEAFAIPGRVVMSTLKETYDAVDGNDATKASFSDFGKQVKDSTFGFGKAFKINTGSKWLDRAIGFVGDVALDPLTYATFGVGKFAGYSGRIKLAQKVLENTGDQVLSKSVARMGRSALRNNPEVLERVGANKFGVYFFGKRIFKERGPLRVPLSGTIGEIGEATLARARLAITDRRWGKYLQKINMPKDYLDLRLKLARNELSPTDAADALRLFDIVPKQRAARAVALQAYEQELMALLKSEEPNLESYRKTVYRLLEDPTMLETATDAERRAAVLWKDYLDAKWDDISARWSEADQSAQLGKAENYFPRVTSDAGRNYMNSVNEYAEELRAIFMEDPFALPGSFTPRSLGPGKKWFGEILEEGDVNIENLNRIAREKTGMDFDFFETDVVDAMRKYISDTADEVAIIEKNKLLAEVGFLKRIEEMRVTALEVDEDAVARARSYVEQQMNLVEAAEQTFRKSVTDLVDNVRAEKARVDSGLATGERLVEDMKKYLYDMLEDNARRINSINMAKQRLAALWGPMGDIPAYAISDDFPAMLRPMLGEFDSMTKRLTQYQDDLQEIQDLINSERFNVMDAEDTLRRIEDAAAETAEKMRLAQASIKAASEVSNALETSWDALVNGGMGGVVDGVAARDVVRQIRDVLGVTRTSSAGKSTKARTRAVGVRGKLKDFLRGTLPDAATPEEVAAMKFFNEVIDDITSVGLGDIPRSRISEMTEERFLKIVMTATSPDTTLTDLRVAAVWAIGRDIRFYGADKVESLPKFVQKFHNELRDILRQAEWEEASRVRRAKARSAARTEMDALDARLRTYYDEAMSMRADVEDFRAALMYIDGPLKEQLGDGFTSAVINEQMITAIEIGASIAGGSKRLPWLYDLLDNPMATLGKAEGEEVTVSDVLLYARKNRDLIQDNLSNKMIEVDDPRVGNLQAGVGGSQKRMMTREQIIADYEAQANTILKERVERLRSQRIPGNRPGLRRKMVGASSEQNLKTRMAGDLLGYQAVADAVQKFEAIGMILAPYGLVPTEDMWRGILNTVGKNYGSQFDEKFSRLVRAEDAFSEFYSTFTKRLEESRRLPDGERISVHQIFKDSLNDVLDGPDGEVISELIGPTMAMLADPADMFVDVRNLASAVRNATDDASKAAAKQRYDNYVKKFVIPWVKSVDSTVRADKTPAINFLKNHVADKNNNLKSASARVIKAARTPMSRAAEERDVYRWFASMMKTVDNETGDVISKGRIAEALSEAIAAGAFFNRMRDGFLDVDSFFDDFSGAAHTPASYATQMFELANKLENTRVWVAIGDDLIGAQKTGPRVAARAEKRAAKAVETATKARNVADAFSNPNLTAEELKALGFTKQMLQSRDVVLKHQELMATIEYANALKDRDIVNFLNVVAGFNMASMTDGIIVGTRRVPRYAGEAIIQTPEMAARQIEKLRAQLGEIAQAEKVSRQRVMRPFVTQRGDKVVFKSPEAKKAWGMRNDEWMRSEKGKFDYERSKVEAEIARVEQSVNAPAEGGQNLLLGYEETPIFATMPDGTPLRFTQAEWDSLYAPPSPPLTIKNLRGERRAIENELVDLNTRLINATERSGATWDPSRRRAIREIEKTIIRRRNRIVAIDAELLRSTKETRNAALEKVRILVQGRAGDGSDAIKLGEWDDITQQLTAATSYRRVKPQGFEQQVNAGKSGVAAGADDFFVYRKDTPGGRVEKPINRTLAHHVAVSRKDNPNILSIPKEWGTVERGAQARIETLNALWKTNPSYAVLEEAERLAAEITQNAYATASENAELFTKAANDAVDTANNYRTAVDDAQRKFKKAIEEMRLSELQAAKAAGAEFDTPTPFWSRGEITYTIGGREYVVPSVDEMLANPMRYVKQANRRGNIFFDMKKPGNVAIWTQASEEVKSSLALFGLQSAVLNNTADFVRANMVNPSVARTNEVYALMGQWARDAKTLADNIKSVREAMAVERQSALVDLLDEQAMLGLFETGSKRKPTLDIFEFAAELRASLADFNGAIELSETGRIQMDSLISALSKRQEALQAVVDILPTRQATKTMNSGKTAASRARWMQVHLDALNSNRDLLYRLATAELSDGGEALIWNSMLEASVAETRFALQQTALANAKSALDTASAGVYVEKVLQPATKEFNDAVEKMLTKQGRVVAENFNMPSYSVNKNINEILSNINKINDGKTVRELSRFLGTYTGFFKAYATLSPGFHVRNSISNTFQLFAAGADVKNMNAGLKLWRSLGEHVRNGGTLETWLASDSVPEALKVHARVAGEVTLGLGGGKTDDAFAEFIQGGTNALSDNRFTRTSRRVGQRVEGSARFMLAFDSSVKGMDFTESFNRTRRFLIDYNDPTILDETIRNVIPFWTWMSRNVPLQIITQWTNPKPYVIYQRFVNNFRVEDDEQLPEFLRRQNPIKVGNNTYLTPDLPFMSTERTVEDLGNPRRLASMLNPGVRVPMELLGGQQFFTGREFDNGQEMVKYGAQNLLPMLGQVERITRTGEKSDELGLARYLGVPVRGVPEASRNSELIRRLYEIQNLVNKERGQ